MKNLVVTQHSEPEFHSRGRFFRDAILFQGKLALDGLRDLALVPVSLFAALMDIVSRTDPPGRRFYEVVHFGKQTEQWIDLFGAVDLDAGTYHRHDIDLPSIDEFVDNLEQKLKAEREKGELSASAKQAFERIIEAARNASNRV